MEKGIIAFVFQKKKTWLHQNNIAYLFTLTGKAIMHENLRLEYGIHKMFWNPAPDVTNKHTHTLDVIHG